MSFKLVMRTPELDWSNRKLRNMVVRLKRMMAVERVPNLDIEVLEQGKPEPPKELELRCSRDETTWKAPQYTACPTCGDRATVSKVVAGSSPAPPPAPAASPAQAQASKPQRRTRGKDRRPRKKRQNTAA